MSKRKSTSGNNETEEQVGYAVFTYTDYRKDFDVDILKVFLDYDEAIKYAESFSTDHLPQEGEPDDGKYTNSDYEYVGISCTSFDAKLYGSYYGRIAVKRTTIKK